MKKKEEGAVTQAAVRAEAEVAATDAKRDAATAILLVASLPIESICKQGAWIWAEMQGEVLITLEIQLPSICPFLFCSCFLLCL
jgi:hypothetical protein